MLSKFSRFRRRRLLNVVLLILSCFSCLWIFGFVFQSKAAIEYNHIRFDTHDECKHLKHSKPSARRPKKLILFYTTIFDSIPVFYPEELQCCEPFNCEITTDKSRLLQSDAVVFHGRDLPKAELMPKQRTSKQRWVFYTMESPYHSKIVPAHYDGMFNWTMTYERRADIYEPYGYYTRKLENTEIIQKNYAASKDRLLTFVNGHCKTFDGLRENFVRALNKIIKVEVHGKCGGIFGRLTCPRWSERCSSFLRRYKFYIALENGICSDYITEKYWNVPFEHDMVPIVFGLKYFKQLTIPGSYIDATQFKDLQSLTEYLKYLDKNDTAYNGYFKWRKFYRTANLEPWPCRLCRMLHNNSLPVKTYSSFDAFLDPRKVCTLKLPNDAIKF